MGRRSSRHDRHPTYRAALDGVEVELLQPRIQPVRPPVRVHVVAAGDRLDHIAMRYYGDPFQYWRLVDANPVDAPERLLEPGRRLLVPERE